MSLGVSFSTVASRLQRCSCSIKKKKNSENGVVALNAVDVNGILILRGLANKEKGKNLLFQYKLLLSWDKLERKHKSPVEVSFSVQ